MQRCALSQAAFSAHPWPRFFKARLSTRHFDGAWAFEGVCNLCDGPNSGRLHAGASRKSLSA